MYDNVEEDDNQMYVGEVQPPTSHIRSLHDDVSPPMLPTPNQQSIESTPPMPIPHDKGTSNIVAHPSSLQGRLLHLVGGQTTDLNS